MKFYKALFFVFMLVAFYWHAKAIWAIFFRPRKKKVVQQHPEKGSSDIEPDSNDSKYLDHLIGVQLEQQAGIKACKLEQKTLKTMLEWDKFTEIEFQEQMIASVKQESILREALKDTKKEIRKEAAMAAE